MSSDCTGANWIVTGPLVWNTTSEEIISERLDKEREAPLSENPLWVGSDYSPGETDDDQSQDDDLLWISQELNRHEDKSQDDDQSQDDDLLWTSQELNRHEDKSQDDDQSQDDDLLWISQELNRHEDQSQVILTLPRTFQ